MPVQERPAVPHPDLKKEKVMKRFLLAVAAVAAITVGSSLTSSAMGAGPGHHGHHGYHHHHHHHVRHCEPVFGGYGGGYGGGYVRTYSAYRPIYVPAHGCGDTVYGRGGVIQIYGPRGGFTLGF
jgi:hypothetical protein